jgi:hypothetical protein
LTYPIGTAGVGHDFFSDDPAHDNPPHTKYEVALKKNLNISGYSERSVAK